MAINVRHPAAIARSLGLGSSAEAAEAVAQAQYEMRQVSGAALAPTAAQITAVPGLVAAIGGAISPEFEGIEAIEQLPAVSALAIGEMRQAISPFQVPLPAAIPGAVPITTIAPMGAGFGGLQMNGMTVNGYPADGYDVQQMALPLVPAIGGLAGLAGGIAGLLQAFGIGEGGGLFGLNILGGDTLTMDGIELGGPGVPEPSPAITQAHWKDKLGRHYYRVYSNIGKTRTKTLCYDPMSKKWWVIKRPYLAVIGKNMPRHQQIVRLRKNLRRHSADARTILKITSPTSLRVKRQRR